MKRNIIITDPCYLRRTYGLDFLLYRDTIIGDWFCMCYRGDTDYRKLAEEWDDLNTDEYGGPKIEGETSHERYKRIKKEWVEKYCYGEFCADSAMVCIAYLDEVLELDPKFADWIKTHPWCVTVVPDFEGTIEEEVDDDDNLHLLGKDNSGKVVFWTTMS